MRSARSGASFRDRTSLDCGSSDWFNFPNHMRNYAAKPTSQPEQVRSDQAVCWTRSDALRINTSGNMFRFTRRRLAVDPCACVPAAAETFFVQTGGKSIFPAGIKVKTVFTARPYLKAAADHLIRAVSEAKALAFEMHPSGRQFTVLHILTASIAVEIFRPALPVGILADNTLAEQPALYLACR